GWEYREEIRIDNTDGKELKNYQVKVALDKSSSGFWSRCKSDGYDIRFVDADNAAILNYYRQSFDYANHTATLWVKVPLILAGETKSIYLYYGRADAADVSSFNNTMVKDFNEKENNVSGINLDGTDEKVSVGSSESLGITSSFALEAQANVGIDYWPQGWLYRKTISIDNTGEPQISNVVVQFDVPYQAEIKNDYSDLAFWEKDHSRKLRYEIMSHDGTKATVRVEMDLPENAAKDIFMYYGNASVVSGSMSVGTVISDIKVASGNNSTDRYVYVDGILRDTTQRSYSVTRLDEKGDFVEVKRYDCYGSFEQATAMKTYLSGLPWGTVVIVNTYNEPRNNVYNNSTLIAALTDFGATSSTIQSLQSLGSYILIGWKGAGAGNALVEKSGATNVSVFYDTETEGDLLAARACSRATVFSLQETEPATLKWLPGFGYRKTISLDNTSGDTLTNPIVKFSVAYESGKMKADYSDLKFIDNDGNKLRYYIKSADGSAASVYVLLPLIPGNSKKEIAMYYGNTAAVDEGDSALDYLLFDDFEGTSLNSDLWVAPASTYSISNGQLTMWGGDFSIYSKMSFSGNYTVKARLKTTSISGDFDSGVLMNYQGGVNGYFGIFDTTGGGTASGIYRNWSSSIKSFSSSYLNTTDWVTLSLKREGSILTLENEGVESISVDDSTYTSGPVGLFSDNDNSGSNMVVDWIMVTSNEAGGSGQQLELPASFGAEEAQPVINRTIIGKSGAYELKFDKKGLSGLINGEDVVSSIDYKINSFSHLGFSYDGSTAKLFIGGLEVASQEYNGAVNTNANPLVIGEGIKGIIDEARVWGRACSAGEIEENQERRLSPADETSLVCYLMFNE
ncbi:MAG: DUF2341 domain-containing protein, partial [Dehalococcoidales bacterium]|nr:DUF2341 domain-containing protein [Dehalococcoidales bacterium]